jgi:hypothetical protein
VNAKTRGGTDFPGYAESGSIEISAPGAFTAIEISGAKKKTELLPLNAADSLC